MDKKKRFFCIVPPHVVTNERLMEEIERQLYAKGLYPEGLRSSVSLSSEEVQRILAVMPGAPMSRLDEGATRSFTVFEISPNVAKAAHVRITSLLYDPDVTYPGSEHLPQYAAGRDTRRVKGAPLTLKNLVMIPVTEEEREVLDMLTASLADAA